MQGEEPQEEAGEEQETGEWEGFEIPFLAKLPGILMIGLMSWLWLTRLMKDGMVDWGISADGLRHQQFDTIVLHMFAHGAAFHIIMNMTVLYSLSALLIARMGTSVASWLRFAAFYLASGLAAAALYLLVHPFGTVPMIGASGAICGLMGLTLRLRSDRTELHPILSQRMKKHMIDFAKENAMLILLLTVPAVLSGRGGGVAWEAHVGGLLFGLFAGPYFLPPAFDRSARSAA